MQIFPQNFLKVPFLANLKKGVGFGADVTFFQFNLFSICS